MKNINDKAKIIVGWLLLALGLSVIGYSLFSAYQVFKGYEEAPLIFVAQIEEVKEINQVEPDPLGLNMEGIMTGVFEDLLPLEYIPVFLNISVFTIFVFILITGGFKISTLGIKLLSNEQKQQKE